jgi:putative copper export protein
MHILGAAVWTGGHLVLVLGFLPRALRDKDPRLIEQFESRFERVGIPALVVQVVTGLWLAHIRLPAVSEWFTLQTVQSTHICLKLVLLLLPLALAIHARLRLIPRLDAARLNQLAFHMVSVTVLAVLFVVLGVGFRVGGIF